MNEWIDINEETPDNGQRVLIATDRYAVFLAIADFWIGSDGEPYFYQPFYPWHFYHMDEVFWWTPIPDRLDI